MTYTYEKLSSNKAKLAFTIDAAAFEEAMQKAYLKMRGKVNIPGFRRGRAPRKMIENMYGEAVFYDDAFEILFPDAYEAAVAEYALEPVDRPDVDVEEIGTGKDLKFTVEVFVKPDVALGEYKALTIEHEDQEVTEEQVTSRIEQDRERTSRMVDVDDRAVAQGDIVNLDYAGTVDGVAFDGGTAQGQTLQIGSNQFIPGFEEQMVGIAIGEEKDLNVTFPEQYHADNLAGKAAVFHVKVNGIQVKELPELDDDFAMDVSDFNTFDEYKADVKAKLEENVKKNNEIAIENALVAKAVENATVEIPNAMVEEQVTSMLREMQMRMAYQGLKMEDYLKYTGQTVEQMREMYKGEAANRVKTQLVLEAICKAEAVTPSEEDVKAQIAQQAEYVGQDVETFEKNLNAEQREYLTESAAIQKAIDLMKAGAVIVKPAAKEEEKKAPKARKPRAKKAETKTEEPKAEEEA
ncbi:MAG: trigger factor [Clostridia bacterium]|nr:trigger factor [Clostridia bacterium]